MSNLLIPSLEDYSQAARSFLKIIGDTPVIAFSGELGAGKTTFIQWLCKELGIPTEVNSPTFSLVNQYFMPDGSSVYHFDLYRIEDPGELYDMGYEEYFYSGDRCFIEWPEKASELIPKEALWVEIKVRDDLSRELIFELPQL
jgi:tRNA threonylcarbamoyladenosine biosynthesis protein TsaE